MNPFIHDGNEYFITINMCKTITNVYQCVWVSALAALKNG